MMYTVPQTARRHLVTSCVPAPPQVSAQPSMHTRTPPWSKQSPYYIPFIRFLDVVGIVMILTVPLAFDSPWLLPVLLCELLFALWVLKTYW